MPLRVGAIYLLIIATIAAALVPVRTEFAQAANEFRPPDKIAFDLQGHRGARGLAPENTLPAFATALSVGVTTLELDLAMTSDGVAWARRGRRRARRTGCLLGEDVALLDEAGLDVLGRGHHARAGEGLATWPERNDGRL